MKRPSFQFYPGDWLNDAALRMCSVGARGLWIEMLCLMHQGSDYGVLKVNHTPILQVNLARISGATLPDVEGWVVELETAGVFSRDESGCIFSRRMIRDEEVRAARAAGGKLGGNPALKGSKKVASKDNLPANLQPTPSSSSSSSSSSKERARKRAASPITPDDVEPQTWCDWLDLRKKKRAPVTATVVDSARAEAIKAQMSLDAFLRAWCFRGSQGLQAEWLKPEERARFGGASGETPYQRNARERVEKMTGGLVSARAPGDTGPRPALIDFDDVNMEISDATSRRLG
jgi:hypothetical protein